MTEAEWLACSDPIPLLAHVRPRPRGRKALLLTCACAARQYRFLLNRRLGASVRTAKSPNYLRQGLREWCWMAEQVIQGKRTIKDLEALGGELAEVGSSYVVGSFEDIIEAAWRFS